MDRSERRSGREASGESKVDPGMQAGSGRTPPAMPLLRFVSRGTVFPNLVSTPSRKGGRGGD